MHRLIRRIAAVRFLCVAAFVSLVCLTGQASPAAADTFNWNVQFASRFDINIGSVPISPIDFAWSFEFDPVVFETQLYDDRPSSLRTYSHFVGSGVTTGVTPLTADIWANAPAGATFTHVTSAYAEQSAWAGFGFRNFSVLAQWESNDLDADPNVETKFRYLRTVSVFTQDLTGFDDVETFDAFSIIEFLAMSGNPGFSLQMSELVETRSSNLTTGAFTVSGSQWQGQGTFTSHVPGSPTPVPEPASMALVATGLLATAIRQRAGRKTVS